MLHGCQQAYFKLKFYSFITSPRAVYATYGCCYERIKFEFDYRFKTIVQHLVAKNRREITSVFWKGIMQNVQMKCICICFNVESNKTKERNIAFLLHKPL